MGTNYYAVKKEPHVFDRELHIGKSSIGWRFLFHDCEEFHTYPQFVKWADEHIRTGEYVLLDEYDKEHTVDELLDLIERKQEEGKNNPENFYYGTRNIDGYRFTEGEFS